MFGRRRSFEEALFGLILCLLVDGLRAAALIKDFIYQADSFLGVGNECTLADGKKGVCRYDTECPWLLQSGVIGRNEVQYCSFVGKMPVVCCQESSQQSKPVVTAFSAAERSPASLASNACKNYLEISDLLQFRIRNGTEANVGEFPHMVALFRRSNEVGKDLTFMCGGSIISDHFILTAAHCVNDRTGNNPTVVRVGQIDISLNKDPIDDPDYDIEEIILHEDYNAVTNYHDIALIRVNRTFSFSDTVFPACLREDMLDMGIDTPLTVTGWGLTEKFTPSNKLLKANLTSVPLEACNGTLLTRNRVLNTRRLASGLNIGQLCAVDPEATKDTCEGDSGGPIQVPHEKGLNMIIGITSFGEQCASGLPSVYTRVAYYVRWIESRVRDWRDIPPTLKK